MGGKWARLAMIGAAMAAVTMLATPAQADHARLIGGGTATDSVTGCSYAATFQGNHVFSIGSAQVWSFQIEFAAIGPCISGSPGAAYVCTGAWSPSTGGALGPSSCVPGGYFYLGPVTTIGPNPGVTFSIATSIEPATGSATVLRA